MRKRLNFFLEPLSPTASTERAPGTFKASKPSISGMLKVRYFSGGGMRVKMFTDVRKNAVMAPPAEERETSPIEAAIESVGDDGQKRGT